MKEKEPEESRYELGFYEVDPSVEIRKPRDVWDLVKRYKDDKRERMIVLHLDPMLRCFGYTVVAIGTYHRMVVDAADIFREAIVREAKMIILAHNHPYEGNCKPSKDDLRLTEDIYKAGGYLHLPLLDHQVFCGGGFHSCMEYGQVVPKGGHYETVIPFDKMTGLHTSNKKRKFAHGGPFVIS